MKVSLSKPKKGKVVVSWTGGKDGCFACYKAISEGNFDVAYLLNFRDTKRSGSHKINIETHRNLVDRICSDLNIEVILTLWNRDPEQIITDFIDAGFEAIVVSAKADLLGKEWLGRKIDKEFMSDLRSFHNGLDLCGELGEYHTFVIDGPMFKNRIRIVVSAQNSVEF